MKANYRLATTDDIPAIAALHAKSWQLHYRGSLLDEYLDGPVIQDRLNAWHDRLQNPTNGQWIMTAWEEEKLVGFVCIYLNDDPDHGALLDNLHVDVSSQGKGYGKTLLHKGYEWVTNNRVDRKMYLWVLEKNKAAQAFYEKIGGIKQETKIFDNPGGGTSIAIRYSWK